MAGIACVKNSEYPYRITIAHPPCGGSSHRTVTPAMKHDSISQLAARFGLSRSTLLYYDRIGLLKPSGRTGADYRYYTDKDRKRMERIQSFRQAGLSLADIRLTLESGRKPAARTLEKRMRQIGSEIAALKSQQLLLAAMLKQTTSGARPPMVDKAMWVELLRAAGMDETAMIRWHREFERRAPDAHQEFLVSLGIAPAEIERIRTL